jgi:hypothetical protein
MFAFSRMPTSFMNIRSDNVIKFKLTEEEKKIQKEERLKNPKPIEKKEEIKKQVKRFEKDSEEAMAWGKMMAEKRKAKRDKQDKQEDEDDKLVMKKIGQEN